MQAAHPSSNHDALQPAHGSAYAALHLPALPLESLLRHQPEKRRHPCAILSSSIEHRSSVVRHANRAATRCGVHAGLSPTRALARCPELRFLERDPDSEATALRDLLEVTEALTPDFELTTPDTLVLGEFQISDLGFQIEGDPHPGFRSQSEIRNPKSTIEALGLPLHLASASTPDLAHLFSLHPATSHVLHFRGAHYRWKSPAPLQDQLTALPLALLRTFSLSPPQLELLRQWGVQSCADLARLPHQGLAERLGPELARIHDLLHGRHHRLLRLFRPAESIETRVDLDHPLTNSSALILWFRRSLRVLCARLASRYRAASQIELQLELEASPPHLHRHRLPEPSGLPEILLRPLATHLEHLELPSPVTGFLLRLTPCTAHGGQHDLFDRGIAHPHRLVDTLTRLAALLGDDRLGFPVPSFTHRPDTFQLTPAHELFREPRRAAPPPDTSGSRTGGHPLSRYRPPVEIAVAFENARPHPVPLALLTGPHRGRITRRHGPFPLSGQWWNPSQKWQQLEWDVRLESRHLLRLSHTPPDRWHLEGAYA